jgi:hypothetical protein
MTAERAVVAEFARYEYLTCVVPLPDVLESDSQESFEPVAAVHAQPSDVEMVNDSSPAAAPTFLVDGATLYVHVGVVTAAGCATTIICCAIVIVAARAGPVFAAACNPIVAFPRPVVGVVNVTHGSLDDAVHSQAVLIVNATDVGPPPTGTFTDVGFTEATQFDGSGGAGAGSPRATCVTECWRSATLITASRIPAGFGETSN